MSETVPNIGKFAKEQPIKPNKFCDLSGNDVRLTVLDCRFATDDRQKAAAKTTSDLILKLLKALCKRTDQMCIRSYWFRCVKVIVK